MKQLIVLAAVLPLLLVFMLQFTLDQRNAHNIATFQGLVYTAKEEAKQEGCFSEEIKKKLREDIALVFKIPQSEILIEATEAVQYRVESEIGFDPSGNQRGMISYKIAVPIHKLMAGHRLFGIKEGENQGKYTIESYTASERLP